VDANGQLGTVASAARFKIEIKPMDKASEAIHALKPVSFRYKKDIDSTSRLQFGLVAEDVEAVDANLVYDKEGKAYSVRYEAVNAMLLNEFLKEHEAFLEEQCKVQKLEAKAAQQQKQIDGLAAGIQKVSAQLELSNPAPQTAVNNH
jgi:trimeric autotransporter adhesin